MIYIHDQSLDFKLGYTSSFEDAPYWYRFNQLASYIGASTLKPEVMDNYQFTVTHIMGSIMNRLNFYYNDLHNLVFRNSTVSPAVYDNAGKVKTDGVEYEIEWKNSMARVGANYSYLNLIAAEVYPTSNGEITNWPKHVANLFTEVSPLPAWAPGLWLHANLRYVAKQESPIGNAATATYTQYDPYHQILPYYLVDVKLTWNDFMVKDLGIGFKVQNLLDTDYYSGGTVSLPYEMPGRWYLADINYKF